MSSSGSGVSSPGGLVLEDAPPWKLASCTACDRAGSTHMCTFVVTTLQPRRCKLFQKVPASRAGQLMQAAPTFPHSLPWGT